MKYCKSYQRIDVIHFLRLKLSEKTLTLPKHGDVILNTMTKTRKKWDSLVLSEPEF